MNQPQNNNKTVTTTVTQVAYSAPLPEASQFQMYEQTVQGAGSRIIGMAERQGKHRQFIEKVCVIGDQVRAGCGLFCGLIVALAGLAGTVYLIYKGDQWAGGILGLGTLGSIVTAFIYGSQHQNNRSDERERELKK